MKTYKKIFVIVFISIIVTYIISFYNTNSLLNDFKKCVSKQIKTNTALDRYIGNYNVEEGPVVRSDIRIERNFVLHNFKKGIMYVNYSYYLYNKNDEEIGGSNNVPSTWYIEKQDGKWIIVAIKEAP